MALEKRFGYPVPCMVPSGLSCHGCPLWAYQYANTYRKGTKILWGAGSMMLCMDS